MYRITSDQILARSVALSLLTLVLSGCGGDSSNNSNDVLIGQFVDSPVQGVAYRTATQSGITNGNGEFLYRADEMVDFSIGGIVFPQTRAASIITPLELADTTNINDIRVVNIARLLQSLDQDCNPDNGISITEQAHAASASLTVDFSSAAFESQVTNLVANAGQNNSECQVLISRSSAVTHLQATLNEIEEIPAPQPIPQPEPTPPQPSRGGLLDELGVWEGVAAFDNSSWAVRIILNEDFQRVEYDTLGCNGQLTLLEESENRLLFYRTITENFNGCRINGYIELTDLSENELEYRFYWPDGRNEQGELAGVGTLRRP